MYHVNINNRDALKELLSKLDAGTQPLWGKMTAQQMVEHLVEQVEYTNGKRIATCDFLPEVALERKRMAIATDAAIPRNVWLGDLPNTYRYTDLRTAVDGLMLALDLFDSYFIPAGRSAIHGGFGPMNYEEWLWWHGKHFAHHFVQFSLLQT